MQRHAHRLLCSALATVAVASFLLLISAEHLGMASGAKAACDTPDLSGCAAEAFSPSYTECVTALIAGRGEPSPFVPAARGTKFKYAGKPGPASGKHPVAYFFSKDGPAQHGKTDPGGDGRGWAPFADKHRALVLTQPKVGTGALFAALSPVSDMIVRSHDVEFLTADVPWVPFPQCRARPALGNCTVVHGIREPLSWLASSYAQFTANALCTFKGSAEDAVRDYHDWLAVPKNMERVLDWWRIGDQLRAHGMASADIEDFIGHVLDSGGIGVLRPWALPNQRPWLHGCNVAVLQMERSAPGSVSEAVMRDLIPGFRFQKTVKGRSELCPAGAAAYRAIQGSQLPQRVVREIATAGGLRGHDFAQALRAYRLDGSDERPQFAGRAPPGHRSQADRAGAL